MVKVSFQMPFMIVVLSVSLATMESIFAMKSVTTRLTWVFQNAVAQPQKSEICDFMLTMLVATAFTRSSQSFVVPCMML